MRDYKPARYNDVSPYLIVADAAAVIEFLAGALGAERLRMYETPEGRVMHGEVRVGDSVVMIADANEKYPPVPVNVHVYLPDVDAAFARAVAEGGVAVQEPKQQDGDPDRRGGVRDPGGNTWWLSTQVSE